MFKAILGTVLRAAVLMALWLGYLMIILFAPVARANPTDRVADTAPEAVAEADPEAAAAVTVEPGWVPVFGEHNSRRRLTVDEAALAITLARVSFNEALGSEPDLALIWQVVRTRARSPRARLAFLRAHSRCVTGVLPETVALARPGNCRWTRQLRVDGGQPAGWDARRNGPWRRVQPIWLAHIERAFAYVRAGDAAPDACTEAPWTWDGRRWADRWAARGRREVACVAETRNAGLVPTRVRSRR